MYVDLVNIFGPLVFPILSAGLGIGLLGGFLMRPQLCRAAAILLLFESVFVAMSAMVFFTLPLGLLFLVAGRYIDRKLTQESP